MELPRHLLPQIPSNKLSEYINFLKENGINCKYAIVDVDKLNPIQQYVNQDKVEILKSKINDIRKKPLIVDKSGLILDGHHRWMALKELGTKKCIVLLCNCDMKKLIEVSHMFEYAEVKTIYEITKYAAKLFSNEDSVEHGYDLGRDDFIENKELIVRKRLGNELDDDLDDFYNYGQFYNYGKYDNYHNKYNE